MNLRSVFSIVFLMLGGCRSSQHLTVATMNNSAPPLYRFFQQHFDSTVICQQHSTWNPGPNMLILAKKGQQVYFFTYRSPYQSTQGRYVPGNLTQQFSEQEARFRATLPDTNQYLLLPPIPPSKLKQTWLKLQPARLWPVRDDDARTTNASCTIEDANTITLWLLTRSNSRNARFYAPDFYEECEGSEVNRRQAIRTRMGLEMLLKQ